MPENNILLQMTNITKVFPGVTALSNVGFDVNYGEVHALVGENGAGKSTLFNLIPRFYDPTSGQIFVDGKDLREVTLTSLRGQIGLVPQETQLFSGSILENLRYGNLEASEADREIQIFIGIHRNLLKFDPDMISFIGGLAGTDITIDHMLDAIDTVGEVAKGKVVEETIWMNEKF